MRIVAWSLLLLACGSEFVPPGPPAYDPPTPQAPDYAALWEDAVLRVGVMIGSMAKEPAFGEVDEGWRTTRWFVQWLEDAGFSRTARGRWERGGAARVTVRLYGADRYRLYDDPALHRSYLRDLMRWSDLFYLGGHARQPGLAALSEATTYDSAQYRIQLFDVCWSYQLYTLPALELGDGHVVSVDNRTVTGSVESLPILLEALVTATDPWSDVIVALNDRAQGRAEARSALAADHLSEAESYGVSSAVW